MRQFDKLYRIFFSYDFHTAILVFGKCKNKQSHYHRQLALDCCIAFTIKVRTWLHPNYRDGAGLTAEGLPSPQLFPKD